MLINAAGDWVQRVYAGQELVVERTPGEVASTERWERIWWLSAAFDRAVVYSLECSRVGGGACAGLDWVAAEDLNMISGDFRTYALLHNPHGDVAGVVDAGGNVVEAYRYGAYGDLMVLDVNNGQWQSRAPAVGNTRLYASSHRSPLTGLYDLRARHYHPVLRQFVSRDPLGYVDSFDEWLYVAGDPFNLIDPLGMAGVIQFLMDYCHGLNRGNPSAEAHCNWGRADEVNAEREPSQPWWWINRETGNRVGGTLMFFGGLAEMYGGGAALITPEPTGATKVGGTVLVLHGWDTASTGVDMVFYPSVEHRTRVAQIGTELARAAGLDEEDARFAGDCLDCAVGLGAEAAAAQGMRHLLSTPFWRGGSWDKRSNIHTRGCYNTVVARHAKSHRAPRDRRT